MCSEYKWTTAEIRKNPYIFSHIPNIPTSLDLLYRPLVYLFPQQNLMGHLIG